jgi:hypothetical protein
MSVDVFGSAVYGVTLEEKDQEFLDELFAQVQEDQDSRDDGEFLDWLEANKPQDYEKANKIVADQGGGPEASLHYSGSDDDRPGRCPTEPDTWLVGFGYLGFPKIAAKIPTEFMEKAEWHEWVTAG